MFRNLNLFVLAIAAMTAIINTDAALAQTPPQIGIVLMHGKGGSPRNLADLASALEAKGYFTANLEMPWSGVRNYDSDVGGAVRQVEAALDGLRSKGAQKLFVAGHSHGGVFAFHLAGKLPIDGVIAIAPGGNAASPVFVQKLGPSLAEARQLIAAGKGGEKARLADFEDSKGLYPIVTTPAAYVSWFEPDGAMNWMKSERGMNPGVPVLYVAPTGDYAGLRQVKQMMFAALPSNPRTRMFEPSANHMGAPSAASREIADWMLAVANAR